MTDRSNPEQYKAYRLTVKNRLNGPYQVWLKVHQIEHNFVLCKKDENFYANIAYNMIYSK